MSIRISDIAEALNITSGTVSRALRDDPRVKPTTKKLILEKAEEMGYAPNRAAQRLARGKSETVWLLVGNLGWAPDCSIVMACNKILWERGYRAQVILHDNDVKKLNHILADINSGSADGAMIMPLLVDTSAALYEKVSVPLVFIDRWPKGIQHPVVTTDNRAGSLALLSKIQRSSKKATLNVIVCQSPKNIVEEERLAGIKIACKNLGFNLHLAGEKIPHYRRIDRLRQ